MNRARFAVPAVLATLLLPAGGCGGPFGTTGSGPRPAHGGSFLELPDKAGYVELIVEPAGAQAKGRAKGKIVAYFTGPDGTGTPSQAPGDVAFTDEKGKKYTLKSASDASSASKFESDPVTLAVGGEPTGTLEAKVGEQAVSLVNRPR
jgi:hypothetical protein